MDAIRNFWIFTLFVALVHGSGALTTVVECRNGDLFGVKELMDNLNTTVNNCTDSTDSKAERFKCIFKALDLFHEEKPAVEKVKGFFEHVFKSTIVTAAKDLTERLMKCAGDYAKDFGAMKSMNDIGKAGEAFSACFFDATKKFTAYIQNDCKLKSVKN